MSDQKTPAQVAAEMAVAKQIASSKTYHCRHNYSNFYLPSGKNCCFVAGKYVTSDKEEIAELDKVCDRPGSPIYSKEELTMPDQRKPMEEIMKQAEQAAKAAGTKLA